MAAARRNHKIYADIGPRAATLRRKLAALDTGARPNFIRKAELAIEDTKRIIPKTLSNKQDANRNPIPSFRAISLVVQLGSHFSPTEFIFYETLAVPDFLGCEYCDKYVEAIRPRMKEVELYNGVTVPIVRKSRGTRRIPVPLPPSQVEAKTAGRISPSIRVTQSIWLPPQSQTWVSVNNLRHGLIVIQPSTTITDDLGVLAATGLA